jgi:hypothetical protein
MVIRRGRKETATVSSIWNGENCLRVVKMQKYSGNAVEASKRNASGRDGL